MAHKHTGWLPAQHGAWAMLIVPFVVGVALRAHDGLALPWFLLPLFAFWLIGYFAFNAASLWLKSPPARRRPFVAPLATYVAASAVFGLLTLAGAGPGILGWVPAYLVLLVPALILAANRRERATLGGGLTTAAASLMVLVVRFPHVTDLIAWTPAARASAAAAALVFAYFFGTVFYVKTNIRERGNPRFYALSVGWHATATVAAAGLMAAGAASVGWVALFAAALARAVVVPRVRPPVTPLRIGLLEIALSVSIIVIAAVA
nr:YwiC-like family protein [Propionibacterium sp.]